MRLAVIPGDGIGIEVTEQALRVLDAVLPGVETTHYDLGAARWHRTGEMLPDTVLEELRGHDAILLGAVGDPSVPSGVLERGLLLQAALRARPPREPAPGEALPGRVDSAGRRAGDRLRGRARGHRGSLRGQRRSAAQGHAARDRDRGQRQHRLRRRAGGARRVRPRAGPSAQAPDAGAQEQRPHQRRRPVVPHRAAGRRRVPRRRRSPTTTSTRRRSTWSPTPAATT